MKEKKYIIINYGCQMNYSDGERFSTIIESIGEYIKTDDISNADLIVFNSCSIRQKAEDRILGLGRKMEALRKKNKDLKVILTGCMSRRNWGGSIKKGSPIQMSQKDREDELKNVMPWVDIVIESKEFYKIPELLGSKVDNIKDYLSFTPLISSTYRAYVPISIGCDHFCTYCIVPFARGREVCRPVNDIVVEVEGLIKKGYKDIMLLGQTVNRYINPVYDEEYKKGMIANTRIDRLNNELLEDKGEPKDFLQLLQVIDNIEGDYYLSFMSSHPNYMTDTLIDFMSKSKHIRPYIHFAMQSGSDKVLKRMNRRYDIKEFIKLAKLMKKKIKGLSLSTDIIVGFPGETIEDFNQTAKVMKELEFDMAYISEYSERRGTASSLLKDDIDQVEKVRRKRYLNDEILAVSALGNNKKMVRNRCRCIIEKELGDNNYLARTENYKEVKFRSNKKQRVGEYIDLNITGCTAWALKGKMLL